MPQVTFTDREYALLATTAEKFMKARKDLPPQQWRKPQHQAVKGFAKRFTLEPAGGEQTRILNRNDARIIQEFATVAIKALKESVIPSYEERIKKLPDKVEFYTPYLEKATITMETYTTILKKVEAILWRLRLRTRALTRPYTLT